MDIDLLERVLHKTGNVIEAVEPGQVNLPTPCHDFDVEALTDHIVGWLRSFASRINGRPTDENPSTFAAGPDAAKLFREATAEAVAGWRSQDPEGQVAAADGSTIPASMMYSMMLGEYLVHGWDLATATGQPIPYIDDEAQPALNEMRAMLLPEYRGEAFGPEVTVPDDASAVDRLVAFVGRQPQSTAANGQMP